MIDFFSQPGYNEDNTDYSVWLFLINLYSVAFHVKKHLARREMMILTHLSISWCFSRQVNDTRPNVAPVIVSFKKACVSASN